MNKFIAISLFFLCVLAVLNLNSSKPVPEEYQKYDILLRDFCLSYENGDLEKAKDELEESGLFVVTDADDRLQPVLIIDLSNGSQMLDFNLRRLVMSAFGDTGEVEPLKDEKIILLKAYSDNRYFMDRAQRYKEMIEMTDENLTVEIVSEGKCDLREEFLNFVPHEGLNMFLPDSSLMKKLGICDE